MAARRSSQVLRARSRLADFRTALLGATAITLVLPVSQALAVCDPAAGTGPVTPPPGTTVTCSGTTTTQNPPSAGYGTGQQNGLTVNVLSGASITTAGSGIALADTNTINNSGAVSGVSFGLVVGNQNTVNNPGTITANTGINSNGATFTLGNSGTITGTTGTGVSVLNNNPPGTATIDNTGTISGLQGAISAIGNVGSLNVTNSGTISGTSASSTAIFTQRTFSLTNSGTISGTTGIRNTVGTSTITNAGTITGTGGTAISFTGSGNTLTLQPGSVINGNVLSTGSNHNNTFQLGGTGTATFDVSSIGTSAQYRDFDTFNKVGASTWTLTGSGAQTWSVGAGTLIVNGAVGSVNVNVGGTLMGTGSTGGIAVASGGTVNPGRSIGTLNVNGAVMFGAGSIYQVEADSTGQADKIAATGVATLAGGTVQVLAVNGTYNPSTVYPILTAANVTGTFSNVTSNLAFLTASLAYTPTAVNLTLTLNTTPTPTPTPDPTPTPTPTPPVITPGGLFLNAAQTFNQRAVARTLDGFPISNPVVAALLMQTLPGALWAFDQLSGEAHASTAGVLMDDSRYMRGAVLGRLRQASYGGETGMASLSAGGPQVAFADGELDGALAYAKSPIVTKAPRMAPAPGPDIAFWAQGFGARGTFDGDGNAASLKRDLAGFLTGVDARFGGNWRVGVATGYTASRSSLDGRGSANVETGHVATYGGVSVGALNLRAGGAYGFHSIDTDRTIAFAGFAERATARYDGGTGQIFGEAGYGLAFGKVAVEPFAGAAWVHLSTDAANEQGGAAALALAANKFEVGYSTLGIRSATMIPLGHDMMLVPRASAAWQHAFNSVTPTAALAFQSTGAAFLVAGVPIARDSVLAEAGLDLHIGRNATLGVSYVGQLARNVEDHAAKGKFSWKF